MPARVCESGYRAIHAARIAGTARCAAFPLPAAERVGQAMSSVRTVASSSAPKPLKRVAVTAQ